MRNGVLILLASLIISQLVGCKGDEPDEPTVDDFDRQAMLTNIADAVIVPAYTGLSDELGQFDEHFNAFEQNPTTENASALRSSFSALYLSWQICAPYEFGPAANQGLRLLMNTFPADTSRINELIAMETYDLTSAQNSAAKTLPALDYVLHAFDHEQLSDPMMQQFIADNIALMSTAVNASLEEWNMTYRDEFVSNTGSSVGSSLGMLVNELNRDFELIKNARIGIPLGKKTLGVAQPEKVEAYYGGNSTALIIAHLVGIRDGFSGGAGTGIGDLLDALDARYQDQLLSEAIIAGFEECAVSANAIEGPLDEAIVQDPATVEDLHGKLQNLVVLLKTDMPSQLGVQITYQDNDGD